MLVNVLTIGLRSSTIQTNTRPSSAPLTWIQVGRPASIKSIVPLRTLRASYPLRWLRSIKLIWTSTCSTLRLSGAPTARMITTEKYAYMHITGRISAANHPFSRTLARCAPSGMSTTSLALTRRAAPTSITVRSPTAGRSRNTILISSKPNPANTVPTVWNPTVLTTIASRIGRFPSVNGSSTSPRRASLPSRPTSIWAATARSRTTWRTSRHRFRVCRLKSSVTRASWTRPEAFLLTVSYLLVVIRRGRPLRFDCISKPLCAPILTPQEARDQVN